MFNNPPTMKTSRVLLTVIIAYIGFYAAIGYMGERKFFYDKDFFPNGADAIVVFFGGFDKNGEINSESLRRLNFAIELVKTGRGRNIIFVGGRRRYLNLQGSEIMARRAAEKGISIGNILFDNESNDTSGNVREAIKIIQSKNFTNIICVSSSFHLLRISLLFKNEVTSLYQFAAYDEKKISPIKSFTEKFMEFNYNIISQIIFVAFPEGYYKKLINYMR